MCCVINLLALLYVVSLYNWCKNLHCDIQFELDVLR